MKKKTVILIAVAIVVIVCSACIIAGKMRDDYGYYVNTEHVNDKIEVQIEEVSKQSITMKLINHDTKTFYYTDYFTLWKNKAGKWKAVHFKYDVGFAKCVHELPVNGSETITVNWTDYFKQELPKGTYRMQREYIHSLDFEI